MRPAGSADEFLRAPVGRYFTGPTFLVWCFAPTLCGSGFWGRPGEADAAELVRVWDALRPRLRPPYDVVTDGRRLSGVDPDGFEVMRAFLRRRVADYASRVRRHAILHAAGLPGAVMAGVLPQLGPAHRWRAFTGGAAAFAWLRRSDGAAARREVEALLEGAVSATPLVAQLRGHLGAHLVGAGLDEAARALGRSPRSLQRELRGAGTSFQRELDRARVEAAQALLRESDCKLETVAARVGFASPSNVARLFRRVTGAAPGAARRRRPTR